MHVFKATMAGESSDSLELTMYGPIGSNLFQEGITPQQIDAALKANPTAKNIHVRISSPGGSVWDGMAIRSMLAAHPAAVSVDVEGIAASVATVIACAGDRIRMHEGARWMMHEAQTQTQGPAEEHRKAMDRLEAINDAAAALYAARSGKSKDEIRALMKSESWLSPEDAKAAGFVDEVVKAKSRAPVMLFDLAPWGYSNVPAELAAYRDAVTQVDRAEPSAGEGSGGKAAAADKGHEAKEPRAMSYERIAMALEMSAGQADEAAVLGRIQALHKQLGQSQQFFLQLSAITGCDNPDELLGAVRAMAVAAEQATELQAKLEHSEVQLEKIERDALIAADAADPKGRKLTPALAKLFMEKPVPELRKFLEVAPHVVQMAPEAQQSKSQPLHGAAAGSADAPVLYQGKKWEDFKPIEKHNLYFENREAFDALQADFTARRAAH